MRLWSDTRPLIVSLGTWGSTKSGTGVKFITFLSDPSGADLTVVFIIIIIIFIIIIFIIVIIIIISTKLT